MPEAPPPGDLQVRNESVQRVYGWYIADRFSVNRRYQRKLVWSVEEKERLIDSMLNDLPVPLFLVAEKGDIGSPTYELIDGLQRLNAIFAFIENEFPWDGRFFDLNALADTKSRADVGSLVQQTPVLPRDESVALANYQLALSVYRAPSDESIDEVFRRINSGGRRLSRHELRQAGTLSPLADLVRKIASRIRGDMSPGDLVPLSVMPRLSISNRDLPYGVNVDDIFWVAQGILRRADVRGSDDEQLVLDLLIDILIDPTPSSGTSTRDTYYSYSRTDDQTETEEARQITQSLGAYDPLRLEQHFMAAFDEVRAALTARDEKFSSLMGVGSGGRYPRYFHAIFLALFELMFRDNQRPTDPSDFAVKLNGIASDRGVLNIPSGGGDWRTDAKRSAVDAVKGVLSPVFREAPRGEDDLARFAWASELEQLLGNAVVEQQTFDAKQGLLRLDESRSFDPACLKEVARTLTAMANLGPDTTGYVALGIADTERDAQRVAALDAVTPILFRGFHLVGVDREAGLSSNTLNDYYHDTISRLKSVAGFDQRIAAVVATESRLLPYRGLGVILLKVHDIGEPVFFEDQLVIRHGSSTVDLPKSDYREVFSRF